MKSRSGSPRDLSPVDLSIAHLKWCAMLVVAMVGGVMFSQISMNVFHHSSSLSVGPLQLRQQVRAAPRKWTLANEQFQGIIHPRDVFLWYTKGEKTSSTVAATLIAHAYERAGLSAVTTGPWPPETSPSRNHLIGAAPGAYASVAHTFYSDEKLERLRAVVQKPVLLVVSVREGSDWTISQAYRAERLQNKNMTECGLVSYKRSTCANYARYLPSAESEVRPWWVLRHEHIIEDTCAMLNALGLECPTELAVGQRSRSEVETSLSCPVTDVKQEVKCINRLNDATIKKAVHHS